MRRDAQLFPSRPFEHPVRHASNSHGVPPAPVGVDPVQVEAFGQESRERPINPTAGVYLPVCGSESFRITSSRLKLAGFCRIGNSLKLSSHFATTACAGTMTKPRGTK